MEALSESITEPHHSAVSMGGIRACHQLHVAAWALFLSSLRAQCSSPPPRCNMVQDPAEAAGPGLQHQRAGDGWQQLCEAGSKGQKKEKKQEYLGDDLSSKPKDEPLPHKS